MELNGTRIEDTFAEAFRMRFVRLIVTASDEHWLDAGLREMLINGAAPDAQIEPRAAGAWLASALAKESGGSIRLSEPEPEVLIIGAVVPRN